MEHRTLSTTTSEVYRHVHMNYTGHTISLEGVKILHTELHNFERGVKEAVDIRVYELTLNHDGGCHKLAPVWNYLLKAHLRSGASSNITSPVVMPVAPSGDQASS